MSVLPITNVVTVSVSTPPAGVSAYQVNNLAIFTKETPVNGAITATNPGIYTTPSQVSTDWGSGSEVLSMADAIFGQSPNILDGGGVLIIYPMAGGDVLATVIPLLFAQYFFGGAIVAGYAPGDTEVTNAAAVCTNTNRIKFLFTSSDTAALTVTTGIFAILNATANVHARKFLYLGSGTNDAAAKKAARIAGAAYMGRAMCVNFAGSMTTMTMHLKTLTGISADAALTQTNLTRCQAIGVDCYPSLGGRASVFCAGGTDDFWDNVYNLDWIVAALAVAGFNALATTGTKIPQTEPGIAVLRGAYINVLQQAVGNGFVAPGTWNSPELFGVPADLLRNVAQLGYYIYSAPVATQAQSARAARQAPLIQIAIKYAGAVHSTSLVIYVNP